MGYAVCFGVCCACHNPMSFNPHKVPSIPINGVREPVCKSCVGVYNAMRKQKGEPEFQIPPGAYDAIDESEL